MALRDIITVGDPRLRKHSRSIKKVTPEIRELIRDMVETMHENNGIGLAAVQVGELLRIVVVELPEDEEIAGSGKCYIVINPEIVKASREVEAGTEGCLSIPGYVGEVERSTAIVVRGLNKHGKPTRIRAYDLLARVFQHEIDHCNGVLYIDRLTAPDRIWNVKEGEEEMIEAGQVPLETEESSASAENPSNSAETVEVTA